MEIKRTLIALCLVLMLAVAILAVSSCSGDDNSDTGFAKHSVTVNSTDECAVSVDKSEAEFAETVTVTLDLKATDKYVARVTYNGNDATKRSDSTYEFLMGNDDVTVAVELKAYETRLSDGNGFAAFSTTSPKTIARNNGKIDLTITLSGSYMTILDWEIRSTNQSVIPGSSVKKSYAEIADAGAISARTETASYSNLITALTISIDTDKAVTGKTFLLIDLRNGNTSSQTASLVVPITVADEIVTAKWQETLVFDVSALPAELKQGKFNVYVTDLDFVAGSDNKEYQNFTEVEADADGHVEIGIEYVPGRRYYVAFWVINDDSSLTCYRLLDTVGAGSSTVGYNQLNKSTLTFISDGVTLEIIVANEVVN